MHHEDDETIDIAAGFRRRRRFSSTARSPPRRRRQLLRVAISPSRHEFIAIRRQTPPARRRPSRHAPRVSV